MDGFTNSEEKAVLVYEHRRCLSGRQLKAVLHRATPTDNRPGYYS